ncbi:MAG: hypothetical protein MZV70_44675 [Desulfobacterales bacterium]|nr:hypothetical protein [Desulfobacterales bacterium]
MELTGTPTLLAGSTTHAGARGRSDRTRGGGDDEQRCAEAGARFFVTPPLFDPELIRPFCSAIDPRRHHPDPDRAAAEILGHGPIYGTQHAPYLPSPPADHRPHSECAPRQGPGMRADRRSRLCRPLIKPRKASEAVMLSTLGWEHKLPDIVEALVTRLTSDSPNRRYLTHQGGKMEQ